jgi:tRNA-Thr(GGU) m(6)t(6)A37 methyltransferase TsaA
MEQTIKFIGEIHSDLTRIEECPLQENENAPEAYLEVYTSYTEGIKDIVAGNKLIVLTWLHLANRETLKCYRRNEVDSDKVGVFSTRSPDRPNPIGLHTVTVVDVNERWIKIFPIEVLDKTPVIDIKPFINS